MSTLERDSLPLAALEQALAAVDSSALLVPPRILRRVIKQHSHATGIGIRIPHRKVYILHREALLTIVDRTELDLAPGRELADQVILLARPSVERLTSISKAEALTIVWRLLFHARVHVALDGLVSEGRLKPVDVRQRIGEIGKTEFDEVRSVLRGEDLLLPPRDDTSIYIEFAAVYLELRYFVSSFLPTYFPSIENLDRIDEILARDVRFEDLFEATRLPGSPRAPYRADASANDTNVAPAGFRRGKSKRLSSKVYRQLAAAAERVAPLGNNLRSAMLRFRAARFATGESGRKARFAALADVGNLTRRLQRALGFSDAERTEWEQALALLFDSASRGEWTPETRLLYDLQKVCVDHERGVYALDLIGWLKSRCKGSIKRPLPGQRDVLISKHLRSAANRLPSVPLGGRVRSRLTTLLQSAMHRAESNLRARFKPLIIDALNQVDLTPHNLPESVAREKLVDELLDRIVERGFLTMGDLRDAISRNNLKLPDVSRLRELRYGDQVLQADVQLAPRLDGVYHRGEAYLRLPQQLSSLAFGTPVGRFLTKFVVLPFGGSYVLLEFVQHLVNMIRSERTTTPTHAQEFAIDLPTLPETPPGASRINTWPFVLLLGFFLLGLIHKPEFRRLCGRLALAFGRTLRWVFYDAPMWMLRKPWIQAIVQSWQFRVFQQYLLKPLIFSAIVWGILNLWFKRATTWESAGAVFVIVNLLLNSRIGRTVDEVVTDWTVNTWHRFRIHVVAAAIRFVIDLFQGILDTVERVLYAVDEWLRFRTGEDGVITVIKAVLAVIWSVVNYVIRFFVNVLIEPQFNPIKHFPVVTVGHKIILPLAYVDPRFWTTTPSVLASMLLRIAPLSVDTANWICVCVVWLIPGAFGFLVWELKENWRLYAANRPRSLQPLQLGHHGETMLQLMYPGFRSGTLPKLYARLRRANRRGYWSGNWRSTGKQMHALHEVEIAVRRFVDRDLNALLEGARGWGGVPISTGEIQLGLNRIAIELYSPNQGENSAWLAFEEQAGWLVASVYRHGWLDKMTPRCRRTFENALAGFYKMAGVDLVREEIEAHLGPNDADYNITDQGLVAWQGSTATCRVLCVLNNTDEDAMPSVDTNTYVADGEPLEAKKLLFSRRPITWQSWVQLWQQDQEPADHAAPPDSTQLLRCVLSQES